MDSSSGEEYKVVISCWGNYKYWDDVLYKYRVDDGKYIRVQGTTSLKAICKAEDPNDIIIFLLDTLYVNHLGEAIDKRYESIVELIVDDALNHVIKNVFDSKPIDRESIKIYVLPGKGRFKSNSGSILVVEGRMSDARYIMYYHLIMYFLDLIDRYGENLNLKVIVDLTHGINYVTAYLMDNLLKLMGILKSLYKNMKLIFLNSDPYRRDNKDVIDSLEINSLYDIGKSYPFTEYIPEDRIDNKRIFNVNKNIDVIDKKYNLEELGKEVKKKTELYNPYILQVNIFMDGIRWGLPLATYHFIPDVNFLKGYIDLIKNEFLDKHLIFNGGNKGVYIIFRALSLTGEFHKLLSSLLYAKIVSIYLEESLSKGWLTLKDLNNFTEKIYSNSMDPRRILIKNESNKIYGLINEYRKSYGVERVTEERYYSLLLKLKKTSILPWLGSGESINDWRRNLIAHAGFHNALVAISLDKPNDIKFRYCLEDKVVVYNDKIYFDLKSIEDAALREKLESMDGLPIKSLLCEKWFKSK